jgi:tRNA-splicing ligase RtcB
MELIKTDKLAIFNWATGLEDGAMKQAENMAKLPFAYHHVALMPDAHQGYGMPIGGVLATTDVVVPNAVGVDIGCGMAFMNTHVKLKDFKPYLKDIVGDIRKTIPVGFNKLKEQVPFEYMPDTDDYQSFEFDGSMLPVVNSQYDNARFQLGTLGGGNHFIEFQVDGHGDVCIMIHSGSRNLGKQVADYYNKEAVKLNAKWYTSVTPEMQLAFLPLDYGIAQAYMAEMQYCVDYARTNRTQMMLNILDIIDSYPLDPDGPISDVAHNYARRERHYGKDVIVHRKGATSARENELGIIPGSQGTASYIVKGRGNRESFMSCSHGAGRVMGRKQAQRELSVKDEQDRLDKMGVLHRIRGEKDLDEAPSAYKDIDQVMANQSDLVEIVSKLKPIAVIKG